MMMVMMMMMMMLLAKRNSTSKQFAQVIRCPGIWTWGLTFHLFGNDKKVLHGEIHSIFHLSPLWGQRKHCCMAKCLREHSQVPSKAWPRSQHMRRSRLELSAQPILAQKGPCRSNVGSMHPSTARPGTPCPRKHSPIFEA